MVFAKFESMLVVWESWQAVKKDFNPLFLIPRVRHNKVLGFGDGCSQMRVYARVRVLPFCNHLANLFD